MKSKTSKQCAQCRRAGTKLFLKGEKCDSHKCPLLKRNFPSGEHGLKRRRSKKSVYGRQLAEKQRAKEVYGVLERQFLNYMKKASNKVGDTGEHLLSLLESRLDNVVYRMGMSDSRRTARQITSHGHMTVNGKKVNIPSYTVKVGDIIALSEVGKKKPAFEKISEKMTKTDPCAWLSLDPKQISAKVLNIPTADSPGFDVKSIIEFYSRKI